MQIVRLLSIAASLVTIATHSNAAEPFIPGADDLALIHAGVSARLLDPASAVLSEVIASVDPAGAELVWVCGNVKGRNTFGGFAQPTPFMGSLVTEISGKKSFLVIAIAGPSGAEQSQVLETCLSKF